MNPLDQIMGVQEAAELWGLSPDHIKRLCRDGKVIARNIGKTWIISKGQPNPKGGNKVKKFEDLGMRVHGALDWEGKEIRLIQDAYIDGIQGERPHYRAKGIDIQGNEYEIVWEVYDNWEEIEDESEMCDWDTPYTVEQIGWAE